jgi:hypothetical protein
LEDLFAQPGPGVEFRFLIFHPSARADSTHIRVVARTARTWDSAADGIRCRYFSGIPMVVFHNATRTGVYLWPT